LKNLTFSQQVEIIGNTTFEGCSSLSKVTFLCPYNDGLYTNAFNNIVPNSTIIYNSQYPSFSTYSSFIEKIPFTLINSIQVQPSSTTATLIIPLLFSTEYDYASQNCVFYSIFNGTTLIASFNGVNLSQYLLSGLSPSTDYNLTLVVSLEIEIQSIPFSFSTTSSGGSIFNDGTFWYEIIDVNTVQVSGLFSITPQLFTIPLFVSNYKIIGIKDYAFQNNPLILGMTFSPNISFIGIDAFQACSSLISVTFPTSLTIIGNNAFSYCSKLKNIYFLGPFYETFATNAFDSISEKNTLFYNSIYPSYSTYTSSFSNRDPFTLINSIQETPNATSVTIFFPIILPNKILVYSILNNDNSLFSTFSGVNLTEYTLTGLSPSTFYQFQLVVSINPVIQTISFSFSTSNIAISNICFFKDTIISTDQGYFPIQNLNIDLHTIQHKRIKAITQTISQENSLVLFKPHALQQNQPIQPFIVSMNHKILDKNTNTLVEAKYFLTQNNEKICKIPYDGSVLYNILMDKHMIIEVNNLLCETLHPQNTISKIWKNTNKLIREKLIYDWNQCILRKNKVF